MPRRHVSAFARLDEVSDPGATDYPTATSVRTSAGRRRKRARPRSGTLCHLSRGFVGPLTEAALERFTFDRALLGADGVTAKLRSRPVPERVRRAMSLIVGVVAFHRQGRGHPRSPEHIAVQEREECR
jgi:hypothetical protein